MVTDNSLKHRVAIGRGLPASFARPSGVTYTVSRWLKSAMLLYAHFQRNPENHAWRSYARSSV
jgi:hypothetical protein